MRVRMGASRRCDCGGAPGASVCSRSPANPPSIPLPPERPTAGFHVGLCMVLARPAAQQQRVSLGAPFPRPFAMLVA